MNVGLLSLWAINATFLHQELVLANLVDSDQTPLNTATYQVITKTCLYNVDPLKPHFYIVKLGFIGVYIIFLTSAQNINCEHSLEPPRRGGSNEYPQSIF